MVREYLSKQDLDGLHGVLVDSPFDARHTIEVLLNNEITRIQPEALEGLLSNFIAST